MTSKMIALRILDGVVIAATMTVMLMIAGVPFIDPALTAESKSSETSRCSFVNSGVDEPPGVQNLISLPRLIPPAMSMSSRRVVPIGASY